MCVLPQYLDANQFCMVKRKIMQLWLQLSRSSWAKLNICLCQHETIRDIFIYLWPVSGCNYYVIFRVCTNCNWCTQKPGCSQNSRKIQSCIFSCLTGTLVYKTSPTTFSRALFDFERYAFMWKVKLAHSMTEHPTEMNVEYASKRYYIFVGIS